MNNKNVAQYIQAMKVSIDGNFHAKGNSHTLVKTRSNNGQVCITKRTKINLVFL